MFADPALLKSPRPAAAAVGGGLAARFAAAGDPAPAPDEEPAGACPAFGYLRGQRDRALAVEFRFADGNTETLPYSHLAGWRFDPSAGLLLKFTADVVTLGNCRKVIYQHAGVVSEIPDPIRTRDW